MRSLNIYKVTESIIVMAKFAQDNGVMGFPGSSACHSTGQARGNGSGDDVFTATEPSLTMRNETGLVWPSHSTDPVLNGGTLSELEPSSLSDTPYMFDSWFRASQTLFCVYYVLYVLYMFEPSVGRPTNAATKSLFILIKEKILLENKLQLKLLPDCEDKYYFVSKDTKGVRRVVRCG